VDIHHIDARGMGGTGLQDVIENLMALCRYHHNLHGDKKLEKNWLRKLHQEVIKKRMMKLTRESAIKEGMSSTEFLEKLQERVEILKNRNNQIDKL